jgi:glycosyltransferase involved in cell wall biosynthesis
MRKPNRNPEAPVEGWFDAAMNVASKEKPLKVLYVITNGNLGGAQVHLKALIAGLPLNIEANLVMGERLWLWDEMQNTGVRLFHLPTLIRPISPVADLKALFGLTKIIREVGPDLIHCHSSKASFLARVAGKLCRVPVVFTVHGWSFTVGVSAGKRLFYRMLERLAARLTDKIICVSEFDRLLATAAMPESASKLLTVYNGIGDIDRPVVGAGAERHGQLRLVMVARFSEPKDQPTLIKAAASLKKAAIPFLVTFVGEGPALPHNEQLATELQLADTVKFLGLRLDVENILAANDVFVLLSKWEGLPLSILEAMRQGLPVIASDVGGVKELVVEGETGFMIPAGDLDCLVRCIREINGDSALRERMGINARQRFEQMFTLQSMIDKTMAVYDEIIEITRSKNNNI